MKLAGWLTWLGFFLVWALFAMLVGNRALLPAPWEVAKAFVDLVRSGELLRHAAVSQMRIMFSYAAALLVAIPLGLAIGLYRPLGHFLDPVIELLRPISGIAWIPLALLIFGVGEALPRFIIFYGAFFPTLVNTAAGVEHINPVYIQAARAMGVPPAIIFARVVIPATLPNIFTGARLGLGLAWVAIVAAELIGSSTGLGFAVEWYRQLLMTPKVMAVIATIGLMGYLSDFSLRWLQRLVIPWSAATVGGQHRG